MNSRTVVSHHPQKSLEQRTGQPQALMSRLSELAARKCIPLTATIEISLRCNLRCVHCYNFDRSQPRPLPTEPELTPPEITDIIDQLADSGCFFIAFTGGEALLHPNLDEFVRHARKRRLYVRLKSNGVLLTQTKVQRLVDAGLGGVDVSLYGAHAHTHDAITACLGSFDNTLAGIRRAKDAGLVVKVNICVVKENASELNELLALAQALDVNYGIDLFITARYDGTNSSLDLRVDRLTLERLYEGPLKSLMRKPDFDPTRSVQCGCARVGCGISATGIVYPCIGAPIPCGNLRQQRFAQIWQHSPQLNSIRKLGLQDFAACRSCPDRAYCGRNSGVVFVNTGDYTGPEPFTCMDASVVHEMYQRQRSQN